jgi:hypothetical protein
MEETDVFLVIFTALALAWARETNRRVHNAQAGHAMVSFHVPHGVPYAAKVALKGFPTLTESIYQVPAKKH